MCLCLPSAGSLNVYRRKYGIKDQRDHHQESMDIYGVMRQCWNTANLRQIDKDMPRMPRCLRNDVAIDAYACAFIILYLRLNPIWWSVRDATSCGWILGTSCSKAGTPTVWYVY